MGSKISITLWEYADQRKATARLKKQGLKGGGISQRGLGKAFMKGGRV